MQERGADSTRKYNSLCRSGDIRKRGSGLVLYVYTKIAKPKGPADTSAAQIFVRVLKPLVGDTRTADLCVNARFVDDHEVH